MYPDKLYIEPTRRSPWVVFEPGRIFIMGRSIVENPSRFYEPAFQWVSGLSKEGGGKLRVDLGFEYINSGSIKWLYILLRELAGMRDASVNISLTWYYEEHDEDMHELGYILKSLIDCSFTIVEIADMNNGLYRDILSGQV
ncbi:MAG: DUF1987 domain-containing protein [Bacteroidales bacterium]|nr:DUF1987 domain-containing protein [Bacteroidales bacterium]MBN2633186.1 DUF1987 domain-containing protein [Bacteroidales bacterium]